MARIAKDITWLVGRTPLMELAGFSTKARLLAKLEAFNPTGSNKDRAALAMVERAEQAGYLKPGGTIVECTSGDTSLALAMVAAKRGYRLILTMPSGMAQRLENLIRALGAELELTDPARGMTGAMERAEELGKQIPDATVLQPFSNRANSKVHAETTAREIHEDTDGEVHAIVCVVGTGGTAAGCAAFFRGSPVKVIGVEPANSAVLGGGKPGRHDIPGIGAGFVPDILAADDLDEVIAIEEQDAFGRVHELARTEGILAGPASGAALHAAIEVASRDEFVGKTVVVILPDSGERYEEHQAYAVEPGTDS